MRRKTDYELIRENGGKYALVMGVTRRARQLNDGARPVAEAAVLNNVATALDEVSQGRLKIIPPQMPSRISPLRALPQFGPPPAAPAHAAEAEVAPAEAVVEEAPAPAAKA